MDEQKKVQRKKLFAWGILLILVWFFGTLFLNAASQSGKPPSDELKPRAEEGTSTPDKQKKSIGKLQVLQPGLNLRSSPKKSDDNVLKTLNKGEILPILSTTAGWYEVMSGKQQGFVTNNPQYIKLLDLKNKD